MSDKKLDTLPLRYPVKNTMSALVRLESSQINKNNMKIFAMQ